MTLGPEVVVDPASLSDARRAEGDVVQLSDRQADNLAALDSSALIREILGDQPVDAVLAVRTYERENFGALDAEHLTERFRMAWSV